MLNKIVGTALISAALYYFLSPRKASALYRNLLFHPSALPDVLSLSMVEEAFGGSPEEVYFESAGKFAGKAELHGWFFPAARGSVDSGITVLFSHGNSGNLGDRFATVKWLTNFGLSVFVYDYRGFGRSEGKPSVNGVAQDGLAAYDYLLSRGVEPSQIVLYGESLGVAVSTFVAEKRHAAAMVLQSGFSSLRRIALETFPLLQIYPESLFPAPPFNSDEILANCNIPVLICHGQNDATVGVHHARKLFASASGPKALLVVENGAHSDLIEDYAEEMSNALRELLSSIPAYKV